MKMSLAMLGVCAIGVGRAEAGSQFLGNAASYNVFAFGNVTQNGGDSKGALAASGNVVMSGTSVAANLSSSTGDSLVVGGTLNFSNGQVNNGNVRGIGVVTYATGVGLQGGQIYYGTQTGNNIASYITSSYASNAGIATNFFSSTQADLTAKSAELAAQTANGTVSGSNSLSLTGTSSKTNYFNLTAAQLAGATSLSISAPTGSTVIVNVSGTSVSEAGGFSLSGISASNVLFNFYQATSLSLSGISFEASILAPDAILSGKNGNADGNTIVAGINDNNSGFEFHTGTYFNGTPLIAVPEPSSVVMMGMSAVVGIAVLGFRTRLGRRSEGAQA